MKKFLLLALLLILFGSKAKAQDQSDVHYSGSLTTACTNLNTSCGNSVATPFAPASGAVLEVASKSYRIALVTVHGTYAGATINFEFTEGGTTYYSDLCTRTDSTTQEITEALSTNEIAAWVCTVSGTASFRARISAISTGTVQVGITTSSH